MRVDSCDFRYASVEFEGGVEGQRSFQTSGTAKRGRERGTGSGKGVGNSLGEVIVSLSFPRQTDNGTKSAKSLFLQMQAIKIKTFKDCTVNSCKHIKVQKGLYTALW